MHHPTLRRRLRLVAMIATFTLFGATACSTDDDTPGDDTSSESATSTADPTTPSASEGADSGTALGEPNPASGDPLMLGFISDGQTASDDRSGEIAAARAAAEYVNEYLGGIAGRPIELEVCETGQTPAGSSDCANELVAAGVPVVLAPVLGVQGEVTPILTEAGVPQMLYSTLDQPTLASEGSYVLANLLATTFGGPAKLAQEAGLDRAALVVIDAPAGRGPAEQVAPLVYGNADIELDITPVAPDAADPSPQLQPIVTEGIEQVTVMGNASFCTNVLRALSNLGYDGSTVIVSQCLTPTSAQDIPGGIDGFRVFTFETTEASDPEAQLYEAVMETYAPGVPPRDNLTSGGYAVVLAFARAMAGVSGSDITPDLVKETVSTAGSNVLPLASEITFSCDGTALAIAPAVCSSGALATTLDAQGAPVAYEAVDAGDLLAVAP